MCFVCPFLHCMTNWPPCSPPKASCPGRQGDNSMTLPASRPATAHSTFEMSCFFKNQVLQQFCLLRCWMETSACKSDVYLLPKQLEEQLETLHFPALGAVLNDIPQQRAGSTSAKTVRRPQCRLLRQRHPATPFRGSSRNFGICIITVVLHLLYFPECWTAWNCRRHSYLLLRKIDLFVFRGLLTLCQLRFGLRRLPQH